MRPRRPSLGFTLVELLVVIAIIGILAGLVAAVLPRALERARIANAENNFTQIRTILTDYYTKHDSYPPMHGYLSDEFKGDNFVDPGVILNRILGNDPDPDLNFPNGEADAFFLRPWDDYLEIHTNEDLYDSFAQLGYDTDQDGVITRLEYAPIGMPIPGGQGFDFTNYDELYLGDNGSGNGGVTADDVDRQRQSADQRPYVYIAVNQRQARLFRDIMYDEAIADGNGSDPRPFDLSQTAVDRIMDMQFPPPRYDAAVLISVGPDAARGTAGLLPEFGENGFMDLSTLVSANRAVYQYHILGLAAHFLATRDAEGNGQGDGTLDFDFKGRSRAGQGRSFDNNLPRAGAERAAGPLIYVIN